jgi:hypothetical protein
LAWLWLLLLRLVCIPVSADLRWCCLCCLRPLLMLCVLAQLCNDPVAELLRQVRAL